HHILDPITLFLYLHFTLYLYYSSLLHPHFLFFFFNAPPTTEIYTLSYTTLFRSLADLGLRDIAVDYVVLDTVRVPRDTVARGTRDRKSTRLNSSHLVISYAVFCLKKKKKKMTYEIKVNA